VYPRRLEFLVHDYENFKSGTMFCQVFSEPCRPLKTLVKAACSVHVAEDLEQLVSALDLHVDRIMQIGMFAMACSEDERRMFSVSIQYEMNVVGC
jgi:hypothetical protein